MNADDVEADPLHYLCLALKTAGTIAAAGRDAFDRDLVLQRAAVQVIREVHAVAPRCPERLTDAVVHRAWVDVLLSSTTPSSGPVAHAHRGELWTAITTAALAASKTILDLPRAPTDGGEGLVS